MNLLARLATYSIAGLLAIASVATSQDQGRERFEASGTVRAIAPTAVQIAKANNELVAVKLQAKPVDISYTANAEPSFLRPGMTVKFSAVLNKRGVVTDPLTTLTVFTPLERTDMGVYPENAGGDGPNPLGGIFADPQSERQPKKKPAKKVYEEVVYNIGGTIASLKGSKMIVSAGGTQIKCELADDIKLKVALAELSYARPGDKVEVEGWHYPAMKQAGAVANRISITAAEPLAGEKKGRAGAKSEDNDSPKDDNKQDDEKKND